MPANYDATQQSINHDLLIYFVVNLSESGHWEAARAEWQLDMTSEPGCTDKCLCGSQHIQKISILKNSVNNARVRIGNCCISKFTSLYTHEILRTVGRLKKNINIWANTPTLSLALALDLISDTDHDFYASIIKKRKLSQLQRKTQNAINQKLIYITNPGYMMRYSTDDFMLAGEKNILSPWELNFSIATYPIHCLTEQQRIVMASITKKMALAGFKKTPVGY